MVNTYGIRRYLVSGPIMCVNFSRNSYGSVPMAAMNASVL